GTVVTGRLNRMTTKSTCQFGVVLLATSLAAAGFITASHAFLTSKLSVDQVNDEVNMSAFQSYLPVFLDTIVRDVQRRFERQKLRRFFAHFFLTPHTVYARLTKKPERISIDTEEYIYGSKKVYPLQLIKEGQPATDAQPTDEPLEGTHNVFRQRA